MARQAKDFDTRTPTARARLAPRKKPYFRQIAPGKTLGYTRREGAAGSWQVRELVGGRYTYRTLGQADDLTGPDGRDVLAFDQALRQVTHPAIAARVGKLTVSMAME